MDDCKMKEDEREMFEAVGGAVIPIPLSVTIEEPVDGVCSNALHLHRCRGGLNGTVQTRTGAASITVMSPPRIRPPHHE